MINILVCGSRGYTDKFHILNVLKQFIEELEADGVDIYEPINLIHGGCPDCADSVIDSLALADPEERAFVIKSYPAMWEAFGKRAGYIRNEQMVNVADYVIAFWDGKSKGTNMTIVLASRNPEVKQVLIENI